jgi:hypothetical protein
MCIGIRRILEPATCIASFRIDHAGHVTQDFFDTPEATTSEHGNLNPLVNRHYQSLL